MRVHFGLQGGIDAGLDQASEQGTEILGRHRELPEQVTSSGLDSMRFLPRLHPGDVLWVTFGHVGHYGSLPQRIMD